jgi:cytochrome c oxidase assembly protein subunit 15
MKNNSAYIRYTKFVLIMVFLVILAGGVVRMTQSGMGCPDWPQCFGRWVPPVNESQLPPDFEKYLKTQDIDHSFNVFHTWIEYINRLLGAILGVFILVHAVWSFRKFRKTNRGIVWLSVAMVLTVGFQGWLGKMVVDANLSVVKVTAHMLVALLIAALPVWIIARLNETQTAGGNLLKRVSVFALLLVLVQIILGTDVREQIDEISKLYGYERRDLWIGKLDLVFLVHRSFSWIVTIACVFLYWKSRPFQALKNPALWVLVPVITATAAGLIMYYLQVPAIAQPIHLLSASVLTIGLFSYRLQLK